MIDIVFPQRNEKEIAEMAERLGYDSLIFVYDHKDKINLPKTKLKALSCLLVDQKQVQKNRKNADFVFVKATGEDRPAIEHAKPDGMFGFETTQKYDKLHERASGLNHILCALAAKNKITIIFDFGSLLNTSGTLRAQILGRMSQNIALCRKYKVSTAIASFAQSPVEMRSPHDLAALFTVIGMHPLEAKNSLASLAQKAPK